MSFYYLQPRYFESFSCIADKCTESCCKNWNIDWLQKEYEDILSAGCSDDLTQTIKDAFETLPSGNKRVILKENGDCPMLNEQGLCRVQKELGHCGFSVTCRTYPRLNIVSNDRVIRICSSSCPAVLDMIFSDERAMELEMRLARNYADLEEAATIIDDEESVVKYPKLHYRMDLVNFFFDLLSDKNRPIETSLIIGALAAKKISDIAETNNVTEIPRILHDIKKQLNSHVTEKSIEQIKPNYAIKLKIANNTTVKFFGEGGTAVDLSPLYEDDGISEEKYLTGLNNLRNAYGGDLPYRNLLLNMFLHLRMPFSSVERTIFENYSFYAAVCSVYRLIGAVAGLKGDNAKHDFVQNISRFSRVVEHNKNTAMNIIDDLKGLGFNSAAHLALIIK